MLTKIRLAKSALPMLALSAAFAHVTVQPKESVAGAEQKYVMRVPNEKSVANIRIEATFPGGVEITALDEKAGWTIEAKKDSSGKIVGAVWRSGRLAHGDIIDFGISARNPDEATRLVWKVVQVYEDGTRSEWTGPPGSRSPAPVTLIKPR